MTLIPTESTWTTSRHATTTHSDLPYLSATSKQDRTYLKFDGSVLDGKKIVGAKLVLKVAMSAATKPGIVVHPAPINWDEKTLTHANRPADSNVALNTVAPQAHAKQAVTVPLTNLSTLDANGSFAVRLQYSQPYVGTTYVGAGAKAPRLVVTVQQGASETEAAQKPQPTQESAQQATRPPQKPQSSDQKAGQNEKPTAEPTAQPSRAPQEPQKPQAAAPVEQQQSASQPPVASTSQSAKKVFAHYFPPYPLSLDNKPADSDYYARNYLTVNGEGGVHAAYGGLLRDRPLPVGKSTSATWQVDNLRTEIRQAKTAGIDGFVVDIMGVSGLNWNTTVKLFTAAELEKDFAVVPMVDGTAGISRLAPAQVAAAIAPLFKSPAAMKIGPDFLLSSFKAEGPGVSWWKQIIDLLETKYGVPVSFQAVFLNSNDANMAAFAPIADSFGNWGARSPQAINNLPVYENQADKYGKQWMEPVAPQDMRPRSGVYAEAGNTAALRAGWTKAIREDADFVQMVSWNDYSESTQFAPSVAHGSTFLQISRYYADWFHTGKAPRITEDQLYVTHRVQFADAKPAVGTKLVTPTLSGSKGEVRDTVEALVFLTAPATVQVTVGGTTSTFSAQAGVSAFTVPLKVGTVQAKIVRAGADVKTAVSPHKVVAAPQVQDLQYYAVTGR
ncbi:hypothetical protein GCM10025863_18710 [Microbacterium suwonense]|uniref:Carbohydrate-binding module family 96 domain-containing protein n=1 Tax=Microbacterium suwonense TaxID=683047 RepID=A0ABM8FU93_9MICO|nr:hypothetical protein GCM10025863_18710 [Microbacterium suwonense]